MARTKTLLLTAALASLLAAGPASATIHLSFGLYTSNKPTTMVRQFRPVLDILEARASETLGTPVEIRIQVAKDYEQGIEHLASGKVDFSRFGPASYIEAKRANSGLRILAMERVRGDKVFYGIIAVAKDSPISSVQQLRGKSFAFGNDQSTIGRFLSQLYLRNHGIYSADLSRFEYLGRHDTVGTAVGAGHFDAGALNEATYSKLVAKGVPIRELARFPNVTKPWIAREGLPQRLFDALRHALLTTEDEIVTATLKADGFVPGEDSDFADIRAAIEMNDKFFETPAVVASDDPAREEDGSIESAPETAAVEPGTDWPDADIDVPGIREIPDGTGWAEADVDVGGRSATSMASDAAPAGTPASAPGQAPDPAAAGNAVAAPEGGVAPDEAKAPVTDGVAESEPPPADDAVRVPDGVSAAVTEPVTGSDTAVRVQ